VALALDAQFSAVSSRGARRIAAPDFFLGLWTTALEPDELLTAVSFTVWDGRCGFAVEEFARRHGDFAIAGAAVAVSLDASARVARCGIGLFGLGSTALLAQVPVVGTSVSSIDADDVGQAALSSLNSVPSDLHGSAVYRKRVGAAMVARAWRRAVSEALDA
jgi:carbon-monoxide dehydrogenase medium subunit